MTHPASPASTACQRWTLGRHSWRHTSEGGFDPRRFTVEQIPEAAARAFVCRNHYSASYPAARLARGVFTDDDTLVDDAPLVGVAVLSIPMRAAVLTNVFPDLEPFAESLALGRFVLTDAVPANAESWFLAQVWRRAAAAGIRGIVTFADPMPRHRTLVDVDAEGQPIERVETITPGHVGAIYQATNAISLGRSTARTLNYCRNRGRMTQTGVQ